MYMARSRDDTSCCLVTYGSKNQGPVSLGDRMDVFHLPKNWGNSGWDVNGTGLFGSFHWKFSRMNRISEMVVPFSW